VLLKMGEKEGEVLSLAYDTFHHAKVLFGEVDNKTFIDS